MLFSKFFRCFYNFSREVFDRPPIFWKYYYCDIAIFIYGCPRLSFLIWKMYQLKTINENYSEVKLTTNSFFNKNPVIFMIIGIFGAFHIFCETALVQINPLANVFRFWRQMVVQFQDDYYKCALDRAQLTEKIQNQRLKLINKMEQNSLLKWIARNFMIQITTQIISNMIVVAKLENIHQQLFYQCKIDALPSLGNECKRKAILALTLIDSSIFALHIILGKKK